MIFICLKLLKIAKTIINFSLEFQDQNLLFTFFTNDYEAKFRQIAFSELVRISHGQRLISELFSITAFTLCTGSQYVLSDM